VKISKNKRQSEFESEFEPTASLVEQVEKNFNRSVLKYYFAGKKGFQK